MTDSVAEDMIARLTKERDWARSKLDGLVFAVISEDLAGASWLAREHTDEWQGPASCWAPPYTAAFRVAYTIPLPRHVFSVPEMIALNASCTFACWVRGFLAANEFVAYAECTLSGASFYVPRICIVEPKTVRTVHHHDHKQIQRTNVYVPPAPAFVVDATSAYHEASHNRTSGRIDDELKAAASLHELGKVYAWPTVRRDGVDELGEMFRI